MHANAALSLTQNRQSPDKVLNHMIQVAKPISASFWRIRARV